MRIHDALYQRIVIQYAFQGIMQEQVKEYINSRLKLCGVNRTLLQEAAYEIIGSYSNGSIRKLDHYMHKALMIGCSKNADVLDTEIIREAVSEAELL